MVTALLLTVHDCCSSFSLPTSPLLFSPPKPPRRRVARSGRAVWRSWHGGSRWGARRWRSHCWSSFTTGGESSCLVLPLFVALQTVPCCPVPGICSAATNAVPDYLSAAPFTCCSSDPAPHSHLSAPHCHALSAPNVAAAMRATPWCTRVTSTRSSCC